MKTKEELIKDLADVGIFNTEKIEIEVQIDIRDQLKRIADLMEPQIIGMENIEVPEVPGFEGTREALDKFKIR